MIAIIYKVSLKRQDCTNNYLFYLGEYWVESDTEVEEDLIGEQAVPLSPAPILPANNIGESLVDIDVQPIVWCFISLYQTLHSISDKAVTWLLKFMTVFLKFCGSFSPKLQRVYEVFPSSLYLRDKYLKINSDSIVYRYVVCPLCHALFKYDDCYEKSGTQLLTKKCQEIVNSKKCNAGLLKQVVCNSGTVKLYPLKTYCYNSLISTLQQFLLRPGFVKLCESTRKAWCDKKDEFKDIYHGQIWKEFLKVNEVDFLSLPLSYGLMLNIDWFQPFDHFIYSVGVIYLVVLNLPREVRYKRENVIIVGVIPGPKEPPLVINSYLSPLVTELWNGVELEIHDSTSEVIRVALLGVACDMPAGRKVCGFLSHSANLGCPRCYCEFSEGGLQRNYSNFDRSSWVMRNNEKHRSDVDSLLQASNASAPVI